MTSLRDRLARAIRDATHVTLNPETADKMADACLSVLASVLSEPTEEMVEAAWCNDRNGMNPPFIVFGSKAELRAALIAANKRLVTG